MGDILGSKKLRVEDIANARRYNQNSTNIIWILSGWGRNKKCPDNSDSLRFSGLDREKVQIVLVV